MNITEIAAYTLHNSAIENLLSKNQGSLNAVVTNIELFPRTTKGILYICYKIDGIAMEKF